MKNQMHFKKVTISPNEAKRILSHSKDKGILNRRFKLANVSLFAQLMIEGEWQENSPEAVAFAADGTLLEGYNRMMAIIKSGVTITLWAAYNVPKEVFIYLNKGARRSIADDLRISGVKNDALLASVISKYLISVKGHNGATAQKAKYGITSKKVISEIENRGEYWQAVAGKAYRWYNSFSQVLAPTTIGSWYARLSEISQIDADYFFEKLCVGEDLKREDPIFLLRKTLSDLHNKRHIESKALSVKEAFIIKTWNAFRLKKSLKILRYNSEVEAFPSAA